MLHVLCNTQNIAVVLYIVIVQYNPVWIEHIYVLLTVVLVYTVALITCMQAFWGPEQSVVCYIWCIAIVYSHIVVSSAHSLYILACGSNKCTLLWQIVSLNMGRVNGLSVLCMHQSCAATKGIELHGMSVHMQVYCILAEKPAFKGLLCYSTPSMALQWLCFDDSALMAPLLLASTVLVFGS